MSVHPSRRVRLSKPVVTPSVVAADILKSDHPLNTPFVGWLIAKGNPKATPTKRQAAEFLRQFPLLRGAAKAA